MTRSLNLIALCLAGLAATAPALAADSASAGAGAHGSPLIRALAVTSLAPPDAQAFAGRRRLDSSNATQGLFASRGSDAAPLALAESPLQLAARTFQAWRIMPLLEKQKRGLSVGGSF